MELSPSLLSLFQRSARIVVLTGAGVSAESGIPTFREAQTGLWESYNPEELATPQAFQRNPTLVWNWYAHRREIIARAHPNPAHHALADFEELFPAFALITQNIDNLHHRAGSSGVIELHGNIFRSRCLEEDTRFTEWEETDPQPPRCPVCGGTLRPDVVWFTESLPQDALYTAFNHAENADIFLSVGTSALVQPAASLPLVAKSSGAHLIEINPDTTPISREADHRLRGSAGEILPELVDRIRQMHLSEKP